MKNKEQIRGKLQEAYEDSLIALLMDQYAAEEGQRLIDESRRLEESGYELPEGADERIYKALEDAYKSENRAKSAKGALKALSRVAVILLVCGVVFATLFATVSAFREAVYTLVSQGSSLNTTTRVGDLEQVHNEVQGKSGNKIEAPPGAYLPTWLPSGYSLRTYSSDILETSIIYNNDQNDLIMYFEYPNNQVLAIDTENAERVEDVRINEFDGILTIKGHVISVTWVDKDRNLLIRVKATNTDKETVLKIAGSVNKN